MKKILIICGGLQVGGAEKVAANICIYEKSREFEFHYVVFEGNENVYGKEIEDVGGKVFEVPSPSTSYVQYVKKLVKLIKKYQYIAVHSHTMFNSGINLLIAYVMKVPCRIAHSHTTKTETRVSAKQKIYETFMRWIICKTSTTYFACGVEAGEWLFGKKNFHKKGYVIKNGIDVEMYSFSIETREKIRKKLGLENKFVIGHSGTILPLKNQIFLVELLPEILRRKDAVLILMGNGPEEYVSQLKSVVREQNLETKVFFCGCIDNVYEYLSALDVFAFPSTREGTPLAVIEAQANGLPCIISDVIPDDVKITELVKKVPLHEKIKWIEELCNAERKIDLQYAKILSDRGYDIQTSMNEIYRTYRESKHGKRNSRFII